METTNIEISSSSYDMLKALHSTTNEKDINSLFDSILLEYIDIKIDNYLNKTDMISIDDALKEAKEKWQ